MPVTQSESLRENLRMWKKGSPVGRCAPILLTKLIWQAPNDTTLSTSGVDEAIIVPNEDDAWDWRCRDALPSSRFIVACTSV